MRHAVFEDILVGLGVSRPLLMLLPQKPIIYVQCGGAQEASMRMLLHKVGKGSFCG